MSPAVATPSDPSGPGAGRRPTPDSTVSAQRVSAVRAPASAVAPRAGASSARPLFAFWGAKHHRLDGFSFVTATRGSGTGVQLEVAWKTYRGVKSILPKVIVQSRIDDGKWVTVKGATARIQKRYVKAAVPAHVVTAGVAAQTVDYRMKSKKLRKGPRRARRSVTSAPFTVIFENQAMYTGDQARFYAPIATLCPNASITLDTTDITEEHDGVYDWQYGITIDAVALAAAPQEPEVSKLGIAIHECAHMKQFYNWGGTNQTWRKLVARSAEVFVADNNPDPAVVTVPMKPTWSPLEHAADCAKELISSERYRTYGGYCNPTESAAAALLWQNQPY